MTLAAFKKKASGIRQKINPAKIKCATHKSAKG